MEYFLKQTKEFTRGQQKNKDFGAALSFTFQKLLVPDGGPSRILILRKR